MLRRSVPPPAHQPLQLFEPAALPASAFTLKSIEGRKGLSLPAAPNSCQMLAWLARCVAVLTLPVGIEANRLRAFPSMDRRKSVGLWQSGIFHRSNQRCWIDLAFHLKPSLAEFSALETLCAPSFAQASNPTDRHVSITK